MTFRPFCLTELPHEGLYWVAITRPLWEIDAGDCGELVGTHTGETESLVVMVEVELTPQGDFPVGFSRIDYTLGCVDDSDTIVSLAPVVIPTHPSQIDALSVPDAWEASAANGDSAFKGYCWVAISKGLGEDAVALAYAAPNDDGGTGFELIKVLGRDEGDLDENVSLTHYLPLATPAYPNTLEPV